MKTLNNLNPFRKKNELVVRHNEQEHPFFALQHRMNRMLDDFFRGFDIEPLGRFASEGAFVPQMNISEDDKEIVISTELPGIDEKELDISITKDALTISGEKNTETEENKKNYHRIERSYGSFSRSIVLPDGIDESMAEAELKKGVLKIRIPKTTEARSKRRKIEVKGD